MKQTATRAAGAAGWTTELGWGILNAGAAVTRAVELGRDTLPPKTSRRGGRRRSVVGRFTLALEGARRGSSRRESGAASTPTPSTSKRGKRFKLIATTRSTRYRLPRQARQALLLLRARTGPGRESSSPRAARASWCASGASPGSKLRPMATGPRTILLAAPRGYCAGVDRAVQTVEKALDLYGPPVYVRKEIVHNKHVVESLEQRGADVRRRGDRGAGGRDGRVLRARRGALGARERRGSAA